MLQLRNNNYFESKNITQKGIIFFLQRWLELFELRTISSYKFYITNSVVGLHELLDVIIKTKDGSFNNINNYDACRLELLEIVKADNVLKKYKIGIYNTLINILGKKIKLEETAKFNRIKSQINYILKILEEEYKGLLENELLQSIKADDFEAIQKYMKSLASLCIYEGWTPKGLTIMIYDLFVNYSHYLESFDIDIIWNKFKERIDKDSDYFTFVKIEFSYKNENVTDDKLLELIDKLGLHILDKDEILEIINNNNNDNDNETRLQSDSKYIFKHIRARDGYAATYKFLDFINNKFNILSFYNKFEFFKNDIPIYLFDSEKLKLVELKRSKLYKYNSFLDSPNKVFENTIGVYSMENSEVESTKSALKCVFNYTNISSLSTFPEEKFINLWIALESFMRTGQYDNIISHIKEVLPAVSCKRYIYKLVRNFAEDCSRCNVNFNRNGLNINLKGIDKQDIVSKLIEGIRDDSSFSIMKNMCSKNCLLLFRLQEMKNILENNKSVLDKIKLHYTTVSWQIQRLYRIRNEIAHTALVSNNYINIYIEHLYDYLAVLIAEVVYMSSKNEILQVNEILPYLKDNYDAFITFLDRKSMPTDFMLKNGIIESL